MEFRSALSGAIGPRSLPTLLASMCAMTLTRKVKALSPIAKARGQACPRRSVMNEEQKFADLKTLARMAARLAGRDPDEQIIVKVGGDNVAFDDVAWRYPDFVKRAEAAYKLLDSGAEF
jgi:hypothetical protein